MKLRVTIEGDPVEVSLADFKAANPDLDDADLAAIENLRVGEEVGLEGCHVVVRVQRICSNTS